MIQIAEMSLSKIPFELLKGRDNFDKWVVGAKAYLTIKDLWKWTSKPPSADSAAEVEADAKARSELILLIDSELYTYVSQEETTKAAWDGIKTAFEDSGTSLNIYTLRKFVTTSSDEFSTMELYVKEMLMLWSKVKAAGYSIDEKTAGSLMLGGLPKEYRPMILGIKNSGVEITVDYVKSLLLQDVYFDREKNDDETALAAKFGKKTFKNQRNDKKTKVIKCYNCGGNHFKSKCPELKGKNSDEKEKVLLAFTASANSGTWYIDSGATSHMTNEKNTVERLMKSSKDHVTAANGDSMEVIGIGDVRKCISGKNDLLIKNVLVIPNICANLLSVVQLVLKDYVVFFSKNGCKIIDENDNVIATGRLENDMFVLNTTEQFACSAKSDEYKLWHKRFGHLSFGNMNFLNIKVPNGLKCKVCIKGKQPRAPFKHEGTRAQKKLELIHSDVCGPLKVQSIGGCRFFVTFIDDYTRKVFVYTLKHKSEVFKKFVDFANFVEKQSDCKIKTFRSDGGKEFDNKSFEIFFSERGILQQKTAPYTPQQNGLAERMNRTLLDRVRCMLIDSGLSRGFWAEALNTAAKILNSAPCKGTGDKSPDELWTGRIPDFNVFKVFGCTAFAHVPDQKRTKLDDKGIECTFVGYSDTSKAYRLYNRATRKIIISRDVNFIENDYECSIVDKDDDTFYFDLQEIHESGGDIDNNPRISEADISANESFQSTASDDETTVVDHTNIDDIDADPTFTTRAAVEIGDRPQTRSMVNMLNLLNANLAFCAGIPTTPEEALDSGEKDEWMDAMRSEIESLQSNQTWELVQLPQDRKTVKNKWVFAKKTDATGKTIKFKARLCAKGFSQREGVDYTETFAPVARYTSIRYILSLAAELNLYLTQMDVVSAFLNGPLNEDVYMDQPKYFSDDSKRVCKLKKSIYGLKQSGRNWNLLLNQTLTEFGLTRTISDQCVYVARSESSIMIVMVWVDDILIAFDKRNEEKRLREALESRFKMKYLGDANIILGIKITRDREKRTISIDQRQYIETVLNRFGMENSNAVGAPMDVNTKYSRDMTDSNENNGKFPYREAIGSLLFAAQVTRPDINFSVILLSRYSEEPKWAHWLAVKRIMRYLRGTIDMQLTYGTSRTNIVGYCDSDFAADIDDRKSTSGYVFIKNGAALSWQTKKQPIVAQSTAEAEFTALAFATKEAIWLRSLSAEILGTTDEPIQMYCDNRGAVDLAHNNNCSEKTKHIDVKLKFVHFEIEERKILLNHISTDNMLADVLTKSLTKDKHQKCIGGFGLN